MADSFLKIQLQHKGKLLKVQGNKIELGSRLEKRLGDKGLLKKDVKEIAQMIKEKITSNILTGKNYNGGNVPRNRKSTIEGKGFDKPLINTGKLSKSVIVADEGGKVVVRMAKTSYSGGQTVAEVAGYLQEGTEDHWVRPKKKGGVLSFVLGGRRVFSKGHIVSGIKPMRFFGISKKDLNAFTKLVIKDRLFK